MSMDIKSSISNNGMFWMVELSGELDVATSDNIKMHLYKLTDQEVLDIKLDLEKLDYIDSTGLGAIIGVLKKLKMSNKEIYILNPKDNVRKIFNITGLDKIFKMEG